MAYVISLPRKPHADLSRLGQLCLLPLFGGMLFQVSALIYNGTGVDEGFNQEGASTYRILLHPSVAEWSILQMKDGQAHRQLTGCTGSIKADCKGKVWQCDGGAQQTTA